MDLDDIFAATEDGHIADFSADSEPAALWELTTGETLVPPPPPDPAATVPPAPVRGEASARPHPALRREPQRLTLGAALAQMPVHEVLAALWVGVAAGSLGGGFAMATALLWALGV